MFGTPAERAAQALIQRAFDDIRKVAETTGVGPTVVATGFVALGVEHLARIGVPTEVVIEGLKGIAALRKSLLANETQPPL